MFTNRLIRALPLLLIVFLGACGIKGDLYIPQKQPSETHTPATNASRTSEKS